MVTQRSGGTDVTFNHQLRSLNIVQSIIDMMLPLCQHIINYSLKSDLHHICKAVRTVPLASVPLVLYATYRYRKFGKIHGFARESDAAELDGIEE